MTKAAMLAIALVLMISAGCKHGTVQMTDLQGDVTLEPLAKVPAELQTDILAQARQFIEESPDLAYIRTAETDDLNSPVESLNLSHLAGIHAVNGKRNVAIILGIRNPKACHPCAPYMFLAEFNASDDSHALRRMELLGKFGSYGNASPHQIVKTGPGSYGVIVEDGERESGITMVSMYLFNPGAAVHDTADVFLEKYLWNDAGVEERAVNGWTKIETTFRFDTKRVVGERYACEFVRSEYRIKSTEDKTGELLKRDTLSYEYVNGAYELRRP